MTTWHSILVAVGAFFVLAPGAVGVDDEHPSALAAV